MASFNFNLENLTSNQFQRFDSCQPGRAPIFGGRCFCQLRRVLGERKNVRDKCRRKLLGTRKEGCDETSWSGPKGGKHGMMWGLMMASENFEVGMELEFVWPYRKWGIFISSSFSVLGSIFLSSHHKSEWWWQAHFSPDCWVYFSYPPPQIFDRLRKNVTSLMLYAFAFLYLYIHTIWIATFCMPNFHISYSLITMSRKQSTKLKWSYINLFISLFFFYDSMEALVTEDFQWLGCFGPWVS